jgi:raffinose/stachyose/melibiose transport system substrate-binding protein
VRARRALTIIGASGLIFAMVAPTASAAAPTTLTILVAEQYPAITAAAAAFEKANPGVKIQVQIVSGSAFVPKTLVEVASSNPPDIFQNFGGGLLLKSFVNVGYVANLTSFWQANGSLTGAYLPSVMGPATINHQIYGVPYQGVQPVFFYYNKADFAAAKISPPSTWQQLLTDIAKLKAAGFIPLAQGNDAWALMMWPEYLALRAGGATAGQAVVAGKPSGSSAISTAGNLSHTLLQSTPFEPGFLGITYDAGEPSELVGTGKAAMELQGSWEFSNLQSKTPAALQANKIGFFPFPTIGSAATANAIAGNPTIYLSVAKKSPHQQLAEEFMKETLLQPWFSQLLISEGAVPGVKGDLAELQHYAKGPETSAFLTWQYHLLAGASYFQQSWDQAALPSETQAIYSAVSKLFAGELTGQQFASALNG